MGKGYLRKLLAVFAVLFVWTNGVFANSHIQEDMLIDDIMSLLDTPLVSVASKSEETIFDAPGVLSVISKKQIESYGYETLGDVLNRLPNTMFISTDSFANSGVLMRGSGKDPYNNRVLFMINGRPVRDSLTGGFSHESMISSFPVKAIEKVEIIRGPGSVLYGSSAFMGVINIVTKKASKDIEGGVYASIGSNNHRELEINVGSNFLEDGNIFISTKTAQSDGYKQEYWAQSLDSKRKQEDLDGLMLSAEYKGLTFNYMVTSSDIGVPSGGSPSWDDRERNDYQHNFLDLGYQFDFSENSNLAFHVTSNTSRWQREAGVSKDILSEFTLKYGEVDKLDFILGGVSNRKDYRGNLFTSNEVHEYSLYAQAKYDILDNLRLIAGLQWNKPEGVDGNNSYRGGFIYDITKEFGFKALYTEAFRAPYGHEMSYNIGPIVGDSYLLGNTGVEPETIETTEAQFFYENDRVQTSLTFYQSEVKSFISRAWTGTPGNLGANLQYDNFGAYDYWGIEYELKYAMSKNFHLEFNRSYQENKNSTDKNDPVEFPTHMSKLGLTYNDDYVSAGIFANYTGKSRYNNVDAQNKTPKAYTLLSANTTLNISKLLQDDPKLEWKLSLFGDNLLNQDVYFSDLGGSAKSFPTKESQATYKVTLSVEF